MNLLSWHPLFWGNIRVPFISVITSNHLLFLKLPDLSVCLSSCLLPFALSLDMFLYVSPSRSQSPAFHNISLRELSHHCQLFPFQTQLFLLIQRQMESLITFYRLGRVWKTINTLCLSFIVAPPACLDTVDHCTHCRLSTP